MTTAAIITLFATQATGAAGVAAPSADSRAQGLATRVSAPVKCPSALGAVRFYSRRINEHRAKMQAGNARRPELGMRSTCPRYLAQVLQRKAHIWRTRAERWAAHHVLRDFAATPGNHAWHKAVQEAQRPYPGTEAWLMSCSASEGGWGRWVPNSQGSGVGGWLQFHPGTFAGFSWRARVDAARRGFVVPRSASSWYSPLGQALAGAWGLTNGLRHHWAGHGC